MFRNGGGALWWRVGTGKTRIAYGFFAMIAKSLPPQTKANFLIVCRREAFRDWYEEMRKVDILWRFIELDSMDQLDRLLSPPKHTIYIMSHGMLAKMKDSLMDIAPALQGVAYDEGFLYKSPKVIRTKAAHKISEVVGRAIILSGSMMTARNLEDIYGQLYAINRHEVIGRTLTEFRSRYQMELQLGSSKRFIFTNRKGASAEVVRRIGPECSVHFPNNNNRRIVTAIRSCAASSAQDKAFRELREDYWLSLKGEDLIIKNAPTLITKCQQVSDGFVKMPSGQINVIPSQKLVYLLSQVGELLSCGEKVVIWCAFRESVSQVLQALQKANPKIGCYSLMGGTSFNRAGWNLNGRICVGTEASGSSINFLKDCAYAIYYSMDFHWLNLQQSQGRTNRHDSKHQTCFYTFLQTEGSLDDHVYKVVNTSSLKEREVILQAGVESWLNTKL